MYSYNKYGSSIGGRTFQWLCHAVFSAIHSVSEPNAYVKNAILFSTVAVSTISSLLLLFSYGNGSSDIILSLICSSIFWTLTALVATLYGIIGYGLANEPKQTVRRDQPISEKVSQLRTIKNRMERALDDDLDEADDIKSLVQKIRPGNAQSIFPNDVARRIDTSQSTEEIRVQKKIENLPSSKIVIDAIKRSDLSRLKNAMSANHIDARERLNSRNKWTAMHYAAYYGDINIIKFLVEKYPPTDVDVNGYSPCDIAEFGFREYAICKYLTDGYVRAKQEELGLLEVADRRSA